MFKHNLILLGIFSRCSILCSINSTRFDLIIDGVMFLYLLLVYDFMVIIQM